MKRLISFILLIVTFAQLRADEASGTLTLEQDKVVFRSKSGDKLYEAMAIPGFKVIGFTPKVQVADGKETDVSELSLELPSGLRITLVAAKPFQITRTTDGADTAWTTQQK